MLDLKTYSVNPPSSPLLPPPLVARSARDSDTHGHLSLKPSLGGKPATEVRLSFFFLFFLLPSFSPPKDMAK